MLRIRSAAICGILALLVACAVSPGSVSDSQPSGKVKAELAPTGALRAAINYNNPLLATRNPQTGELSGVAVDLSRELARRLAVPVQLIAFDAAGKMGEAARNNEIDVAYLAIDAARAGEFDFTAAYLDIEGTYLVPANSAARTVEDMDRDGARIAVTQKSAYDLFLTRELKHAQLVRANATPESIELMSTDELDGVAAVRTALTAASRRIPGSRVLPGHFMTIAQAAAVPKGRPLAAQYVSDFIEEAKASGRVAESLQAHGLSKDDALVAAPAGKPHTAAASN